MNAVRKHVDDAKEINSEKGIALVLGGPTMAVEKSKYTVDEIQKRATEVGPVLEEMLHSHWEHWGLNE